MNYQETIEYLFNSTPVFEKIGATAYKPGLQTTRTLDEHFAHPHRAYKTIHIAGTNGKGSCSHTIAAILQAEGYKVGLYTSPHLVDFRERIRINGKCIPEQYVIDFVEKERAFFEPLHPSFFELTTALAFKYFKEQQVDYAVIEVGLGGRLDCTNIITPILSVITNISLDHTQLLGDTLAKIAHEKAGIIKTDVPVVIGEKHTETEQVFKEVSREKNAPIVFAQDLVAEATLSNKDDIMSTNFIKQLDTELKGDYQKRNTQTILAAISILNSIMLPKVKTTSIVQGFAHVCELTGLRGRWEKISTHPLVICDTGHNTAAWKYLSQQIAHQPCKHKHIVFGMVDDKDIEGVLEMLPHQDTTYYWTQATTKRAIPVEKLQELALTKHLTGKAYHSVKEAFKDAMLHAEEDDFVYVGGSSYIVADFLS